MSSFNYQCSGKVILNAIMNAIEGRILARMSQSRKPAVLFKTYKNRHQKPQKCQHGYENTLQTNIWGVSKSCWQSVPLDPFRVMQNIFWTFSEDEEAEEGCGTVSCYIQTFAAPRESRHYSPR